MSVASESHVCPLSAHVCSVGREGRKVRERERRECPGVMLSPLSSSPHPQTCGEEKCERGREEGEGEEKGGE